MSTNSVSVTDEVVANRHEEISDKETIKQLQATLKQLISKHDQSAQLINQLNQTINKLNQSSSKSSHQQHQYDQNDKHPATQSAARRSRESVQLCVPVDDARPELQYEQNDMPSDDHDDQPLNNELMNQSPEQHVESLIQEADFSDKKVNDQYIEDQLEQVDQSNGQMDQSYNDKSINQSMKRRILQKVSDPVVVKRVKLAPQKPRIRRRVQLYEGEEYDEKTRKEIWSKLPDSVDAYFDKV